MEVRGQWPSPVGVDDVLRLWKEKSSKPARFLLLGWCNAIGAGSKKHVVFVISVFASDFSTSWIVFRRYSSFVALRTALASESPKVELPQLPTKVLVAWEHALFERGLALCQFLNKIVLNHQNVANSPTFKEFSNFRANQVPYGASASEFHSYRTRHLRPLRNTMNNRSDNVQSVAGRVFSGLKSTLETAGLTFASWTKSSVGTSSITTYTSERRDQVSSLLPLAVEAEFPQVQSRSNQMGPLQVLGLLGRGNFGKVFLCSVASTRKLSTSEVSESSSLSGTRDLSNDNYDEDEYYSSLPWVRPNKKYAVKAFDVRNLRSNYSFQRVLKERNILSTLKHPYIVRFHGSFRTCHHLLIAMDAHRNYTLHDAAKQSGGRLHSTVVHTIAAEVSHALNYIHEQGILMRDLKPDNLLLDKNGHVVLTDFGLAKTGVHSPVSGAKSFCGTVEYIAPEILLGQKYGNAVDWWALGVVLYELLVGRVPFGLPNSKNPPQEFAASVIYSSVTLSSSLAEVWGELLCGLLRKSPQHRLCGKEVLEHNHFATVNWDQLLRCEDPTQLDIECQTVPKPVRRKSTTPSESNIGASAV